MSAFAGYVIGAGVLLLVIGLTAFACLIVGGRADGPDDIDWDV